MGSTKKKIKADKLKKKNKVKCVTSATKPTNSKVSRKSVVLVGNSKTVSKKKKCKRLNYSSDDVAHALEALKTGISLRKAAAAYGVPIATLARKKNNPDVEKQKRGPDTVFSEVEEQNIVNWILYRAEHGWPVTKTELLDSVQKYVQYMKKETPFIDSRPSRHWYEGFRKRHPQLSIRKPQHLTTSRAAVSREDLKEWFQEQEKYLKEKNLLNISPTRIFNCDETNIVLCPQSERILSEKGSRSVYKVVDSEKESLTALFMYNASGTRAPPMLMFAYKEEVPQKIVKNCPRGWGIGLSENGWMTAESFYEYLTNVFYPWLLSEKIELPIIIYLDNHSSHITVPLVTFCREKGIELIGLLPNSTHIMQPLDISFFHPFKVTWRKAVPKWKNKQNVMCLKREEFPIVLKFALDSMKEEKNVVVSGFKASGLYPFDPAAVDYDVLNKKKASKSPVKQQGNADDSTEDKQKHLQCFEKNLPADLILEFKNASSTGSWTGDMEKKGLFEYWLQISGISTGNIVKAKPIIKKVELLINHKVKVTSQEQVTEDLSNNQPSILNKDTQFNNTNTLYEKDLIIPFNIDELKEYPSLNNEPVLGNEPILEIVYISENNPQEIALLPQSCTNQNSPLINRTLDSSELVGTALDDSQILSQSPEDLYSKNSNETACDSNTFDQSNQIESHVQEIHSSIGENNGFDSVSVLTAASTDAIVVNTQCTDKIDIPFAERIDNSFIEKENNSVTANAEPDASSQDNFNKAFTLPMKYLPKRKRVKLEATGKPKLPSAGTSDQWLQHHLEKENKQKIKQEKLEKKKKLQEEKKLIAEEKKRLTEKMKDLQKKIKQEK